MYHLDIGYEQGRAQSDIVVLVQECCVPMDWIGMEWNMDIELEGRIQNV